jgi:hypothetical protein
MATLISLEHLRRQRRVSESTAREDNLWRNAMLPSAIGMGIVVAVSIGALFLGAQGDMFSAECMMWLLIAALVSFFALTKIIIANVLFFVLANEKPRTALARGPRPTYRAPLPMRPADNPRSPRTADQETGEAAVASNR